MTAPGSEWYAEEGLRFECTSCGACCTGPPGYVTFSPEEGRALASALGLTHDDFLTRFTRQTPVGRSLREVETEHGHDCVFLDRTSVPGKAVCGVYGARPVQCKTFPWWPENLRSPAHWNRAAQGCEGVGRGDFVPVEAIRIERDKQAATDRDVNR